MNVFCIKTQEPLSEDYYRCLCIDTLARTIYGETGDLGNKRLMKAIGHVVINRAQIAENRGGRYWWGNDIISICKKPYQFSCWNRNDPAFKHIIEVDQYNDEDFIECLKIAKDLINRRCKDITSGATHYHAEWAQPYWARGEVPSAVVGELIFYNLVN